ncbi:hypothetical protein F5H01DRAFT_20145 [Linnemannia elongata]|nr:hypothetical protein F5H01DRAFT_20145 [Linnemannia elongata]
MAAIFYRSAPILATLLAIFSATTLLLCLLFFLFPLPPLSTSYSFHSPSSFFNAARSTIASSLTIPIHTPSRSSTSTRVCSPTQSRFFSLPLRVPHIQPLPSHQNHLPIKTNTFTLATMNVERNVDQARDVAQEVPQVFASKAQSALESVKQMDVVKRYVFPRTDMFKPPQVSRLGSLGLGLCRLFLWAASWGSWGWSPLGA